MAAATVDDRGLTAGALLQGTVEAIREHPLQLLLPFVLLGLITSGGWSASMDDGRDLDSADGAGIHYDLSDEAFTPVVVAAFVAIFGFVLLFILAFLAILLFLYALAWLVTTQAALTAVRGDPDAPVDLGAAFDAVRPIYLRGTWTLLVGFLAIVAGFLLFIIPGIVAIVALTPWAAVVVHEGRWGTDALRRAWRLTRGHRLDLFLLLLVEIALNAAIGLVLGANPLVGGALAGAAQGVVTAGGVVLGALFYHRRTAPVAAPPAAGEGRGPDPVGGPDAPDAA